MVSFLIVQLFVTSIVLFSHAVERVVVACSVYILGVITILILLPDMRTCFQSCERDHAQLLDIWYYIGVLLLGKLQIHVS